MARGKIDFKCVITVRNEVAKVMFLHLSVCPHGWSTLGKWCLLPGGAGPGGSAAGGVCSQGGVPGPGGVVVVSQHALRQTPQQTATVVDGTHPTGMHSSLLICLHVKIYFSDTQKL